MSEITRQLFEPHVGTCFQVIVNGQPCLDLTLAEVEDQTLDDPLRDNSLRQEPFCLIFHGPLNPIARQASYELGHPHLTGLEMFLVPIGPDRQTRQHMQYQAIFN